MNRRDFIKYGTILTCTGGVCLLCKNPRLFKKNTTEIKTPSDTRPCKVPFECLELHGRGNVYPCCPDFLKDNISAGNIVSQNLEEIWNGKMLTELRQRILKGDYSMCNREICCCYEPCSEDEIPVDYNKGPKKIKLCYDNECNYNCITCRDVVKINSPEEMELFDKVYLPKIVKIAKNTSWIVLSLSGDPLFSRHSQNLMKSLVKEYPDIKFDLHTNGLFLNEKFLTELGIANNIKEVSVSVDAINRETYKKILRTDAFDTVMKNLELMAEWKKQGKIDWITINFVVHLMNYKEMPDFVKLAQKLDAAALFTAYRPWKSAEYYKKYDEVAVFEPKNKHYTEFIKILQNPVFKDKKHCYLEPQLFDIANS